MKVSKLPVKCVSNPGTIITSKDKDVQMIAAALWDVYDFDGLAGWMNIKFGPIRENCASSTALFECYRRSLVRSYCDESGHGPQQVAEDIAAILEKDMKKKRVAQILRQLKFTQSKSFMFYSASLEQRAPVLLGNKERDDKQQVCDPEDSRCRCKLYPLFLSQLYIISVLYVCVVKANYCLCVSKCVCYYYYTTQHQLHLVLQILQTPQVILALQTMLDSHFQSNLHSYCREVANKGTNNQTAFPHQVHRQ